MDAVPFENKLTEIAKVLTENSRVEWRVKIHTAGIYATITRPDGTGIDVSEQYHDKRFHITGEYGEWKDHLPYENHTTPDPMTERPRITVNPERPIARLVADIERRVIPQVDVLLEQARQIKANRDNYRDRTRANADALVRTGKLHTWRSAIAKVDEYGEIRLTSVDGVTSAEMQVSGDNITMTLRHVTPEVAAKIVALL